MAVLRTNLHARQFSTANEIPMSTGTPDVHVNTFAGIHRMAFRSGIGTRKLSVMRGHIQRQCPLELLPSSETGFGEIVRLVKHWGYRY